ncbi:MAG: permease [Kiritimatiellae bacterium]|nr:permease [Kiritimatiellia bacterium]
MPDLSSPRQGDEHLALPLRARADSPAGERGTDLCILADTVDAVSPQYGVYRADARALPGQAGRCHTKGGQPCLFSGASHLPVRPIEHLRGVVALAADQGDPGPGVELGHELGDRTGEPHPGDFVGLARRPQFLVERARVTVPYLGPGRERTGETEGVRLASRHRFRPAAPSGGQQHSRRREAASDCRRSCHGRSIRCARGPFSLVAGRAKRYARFYRETDVKGHWKTRGLLLALAACCFFIPIGSYRFENAVFEGLKLVRWYARTYLLLTLVPVFLVAGAIAVFVSRATVTRYLGAAANRAVAYAVAAVGGSVVAVCSCAVLPLFSGIRKQGAGLGPAVTFLYAGPAINVLAIVLTARVLGLRLGVARALFAILFSVVIGLLMHAFFRNDRAEQPGEERADEEGGARRSAAQTVAFFAALIGVMVFANWARSGDIRAVLLCCPGGLTTYEVEGHIVEKTDSHVVIVDTDGQEFAVSAEEVRAVAALRPGSIQNLVHDARWYLVGLLAAAVAIMLWRWFARAETAEWIDRSWGFAARMLPPLFLGVLAAGFMLGGQEGEGIIPRPCIEMLVGRSPERFLAATGLQAGAMAAGIRAAWPVLTNLFAAVVGVFMYFATLTEVPIVRGLMRSGMDKGPALALLLAGPAVSLPNMLVIRGVIGTRKTLAYVGLVVLMAALSGMIYGA